MEKAQNIELPDYRELSELRYQLRRFLRFSEQAARGAGLEPQQHQLLLALKGLPAGRKPTITALAERLQIEHHSAVELVNRLEGQGMVRRLRSRTDRRVVFVRITSRGEGILQDLSVHHLEELRSVGRAVVRALNALIGEGGSPAADETGQPLPGAAARDPRKKAI